MTRVIRSPKFLVAALAVTVLLLAPVTSASAAEPLPTGTYDVTVADDGFRVSVDEAGGVAVSGADEFVVDLRFDDDGRVLDTFTVTVGDTVYEVEVDVADDGSYSTTVTQEDVLGEDGDGEDGDGDGDGEDGDGEDGEDGEDAEAREEDGDLEVEGEEDGEHGAIVSTVARCAPNGMVARAAGWPNHGVVVRAAAAGEALVAEVTDPTTGEVTPLEADFSTLEGAEAFCAMVAETVPTAEEVRAARAEARAEAKAEREAARDEAKAERDEAKAARAEARAERRAERDQAKTDRGKGRPDR